jgi:hypothetical protein
LWWEFLATDAEVPGSNPSTIRLLAPHLSTLAEFYSPHLSIITLASDNSPGLPVIAQRWLSVTVTQSRDQFDHACALAEMGNMRI